MTSLKSGDLVCLAGLTTTLLNGATGRVTGPLVDGRLPIMLLSPPAACERFPTGVKVRTGNLERKKDTPQPPRPTNLPPSDSWSRGMSGSQQREWLTDCYRMRVDDDYCWGGNLRGLYDPDATSETIAKDFLEFCRLALGHGVIPSGWDWPLFLRSSAKLICFAFEKSDAKEKYDGENIFSSLIGGRPSLRGTGEVVYGCSDDGPSYRYPPGSEEVAKTDENLLFTEGKASLFADVGGAAAWRELVSAL